ncbi:MAG: amidohydrolase family protein [Anaerolineales bacterium]|jgi:hypothetical protein
MTSASYAPLYHYLETLPVVSSHEHLLPDDFQSTLTLDRLLENSYLGKIVRPRIPSGVSREAEPGDRGSSTWSPEFPSPDPLARQEFLEHVRLNSFLVWLEKGIQKIYGIDQEITIQSWDEVSGAISARQAAPGAYLEMLRSVAGYRRAIQDCYWSYGSDNGHPELLSSTIRTDMFVTSFHPSVLDHDGNTPFRFYPQAPTEDFDDYLAFLQAMFRKWRENGAVTLKSASAYDRSLDYSEGNRSAAARVFFREPATVTAAERRAYEDFMFNWFCRLAIELELPFQVHTGLGKLAGSSPLKFEPVLQRYPQIRFVLFHAGYPWYDDLAGLAHTYSSIAIDMVWAPILSTAGAVLALHEFLEVARSTNRIAWGSDAGTSEEAVGALLAWRHVVAKVLAEKVDDGYLDRREAERMAERLMYRNAAELYGFGLSAKAVPEPSR